MFILDPIEVSEIRIRIESADDNPYIGVIAVGRLDEWPRLADWTGQPITEGDQITFSDNISDSGSFIGRTKVSDGLTYTMQVDNLPELPEPGVLPAGPVSLIRVANVIIPNGIAHDARQAGPCA